MSETRFTPGPWKASTTYDGVDHIIHAAGVPWQLAYLARHSEIDWPLEANAHLIAAAPELVEALDRFVQITEEHKRSHHLPLVFQAALVEARKALSRARGEAP